MLFLGVYKNVILRQIQYMRNLFLLLMLVLFACKKPSTTPPTPTTPSSSFLMPIPYWGIDTFVCYDTVFGKIQRIDSFTTASVSGKSEIYYKGNTYYAWLDTITSPYKPDQNIYYFAKITDMSGSEVNQYAINYLPPFQMSGATKTPYYRSLDFGEGIFNANAIGFDWVGRNP